MVLLDIQFLEGSGDRSRCVRLHEKYTIGGVGAPFLFGSLIATESRASVFDGYLFGSALMVSAAIIEMIWGVAAERKPLETIARL